MKILVTGGIASGKSTVVDYLNQRGFSVADADVIAREIVTPPSPYLDQIKARFGESVLSDGQLNRPALRALIFEDETKRNALNQLLHQEIFLQLQEAVFDTKADLVLAVPLYFDTSYRLGGIDEVWTVTAPLEVRIKRLMERDNTTRAQACAAINAQVSDEVRIQKSDRVICNNGDLKDLYQEIDQALA